MKNKVALITGITGQDGSYLSELLLSKGYIVHGVKRRSSQFNTKLIDHIYKDPINNKNMRFFLHYGDLTDGLSITKIIKKTNPDEIYNLGAQSHVKVSFENPEYTANVNALGVLRVLESIRLLGLEKKIKFYQASTSEMFGKVQQKKQNENTKFYPLSPYGTSKLFGYWITKNYRESYGMFACNGILFNHESERRGETFVTRKVTRGLSEIVCGLQKTLNMGNLDAKRDWGHTKDYVYMQWLMMQQSKPDDYVIATGRQITVRNFIDLCAKHLDIKINWSGKGLNEVGTIKKINKNKKYLIKEGDIIVKVNKKYYRPLEVDSLLGDFKKASKNLNWKPKISVNTLAKEMINHDLQISKNKIILLNNNK